MLCYVKKSPLLSLLGSCTPVWKLACPVDCANVWMLIEHTYIAFIEYVAEHASQLGGHKPHRFSAFPLLIAVGDFLLHL